MTYEELDKKIMDGWVKLRLLEEERAKAQIALNNAIADTVIAIRKAVDALTNKGDSNGN